MHKHSLKDFARRDRAAHVTAIPAARASVLGRRWATVAMHPREHQITSRPIAQFKGQETASLSDGLRQQVESVGALYAHAMVIEREAVVRYREFAQHMVEYGNDTVAELFRNLAYFGTEHAYHLAQKTAGMDLPKLAAGEYSWLDQDAPVPEARAFVLRVLTPRMALEIALRAEERAKAFFDKVVAESSDAVIREAAHALARDEQTHVAWVNEALARVPKPYQPSEEQPGDPAIAEQL
jgi:rubrerythrin